MEHLCLPKISIVAGFWWASPMMARECGSAAESFVLLSEGNEEMFHVPQNNGEKVVVWHGSLAGSEDDVFLKLSSDVTRHSSHLRSDSCRVTQS